jgi:hypothetical protein
MPTTFQLAGLRKFFHRRTNRGDVCGLFPDGSRSLRLRIVPVDPGETLSGRPCRSAASWAKGHARSPFGRAISTPLSAMALCSLTILERHPIPLWNIWARCFLGLVIAKSDDIDAGLRAMRGGLELAGQAIFLPRFLLLLSEFAASLGQEGEIERRSKSSTRRSRAAKNVRSAGIWPSYCASKVN